MIRVIFRGKDGIDYPIDSLLNLSMGGRLTILTSAEHEAHEGHAFTTGAADITLADTETLNIAFRTCEHAHKVHLYPEFTTLVGGYCDLLEAPTWDTGSGVLTNIINRKRSRTPIQSDLEQDDSATPVFVKTNQVLTNVDNLAGGTILCRRYAWGEKGKVEAGGFRAENEFLLREDTQYAVRFTAIGANNTAQIVLNWIEHGEEE